MFPSGIVTATPSTITEEYTTAASVFTSAIAAALSVSAETFVCHVVISVVKSPEHKASAPITSTTKGQPAGQAGVVIV